MSMRKRFTAAFLSLLFMSTALAGDSARPGIDLLDEGTKVGNVTKLNCVGSAVTCTKSNQTGVMTISGGGVTLGTPTNGLAVNGSSQLSLGAADASNPGAMTTAAQTFAGDKTFSGKVIMGVSDTMLCLTPTCNVTIASSFSGTRLRLSGSALIELTSGQVFSFESSFQGSNSYLDNASPGYPLKINDTDGAAIIPQSSLGTCGSGSGGTTLPEGTILPILGSAGALTKMCLCTNDGTNRIWVNLLKPTDRTGTTTTCPAS
jgi:hypothetical protein